MTSIKLILFASITLLAWGAGTATADSGPEAHAESKNSLDDILTTSPLEDFSFVVGTREGVLYEFYKGEYDSRTEFRFWSASKIITATVIMDLIEQEKLSLWSSPHDYLPYWTSRKTRDIRLYHLLSLTSGLRPTLTQFLPPQVCHQDPDADFTECVKDIHRINRNPLSAAGRVFDYGGAHLQVAGAMGIAASGAQDWNEVFSRFKAKKNVLSHARYDYTSASNPLLGGGIIGTTEDLASFAQSFFDKSVLPDRIIDLMIRDFTPNINVSTRYSPSLEQNQEDWHYGIGVWRECRLSKFNLLCNLNPRISSLGHGGTYVWFDWKRGYWGVLGRDDLSEKYPGKSSVELVRSAEKVIHTLVATSGQ